jgi:hypothetical protein
MEHLVHLIDSWPQWVQILATILGTAIAVALLVWSWLKWVYGPLLGHQRDRPRLELELSLGFPWPPGAPGGETFRMFVNVQALNRSVFPVRAQEVGIEDDMGRRLPFYDPIGAQPNSQIAPRDSALFAQDEEVVRAAGLDVHRRLRG